MINIIGLCRAIIEKFPIPSSPSSIYQEVISFLGFEPELETKQDLVKALTASWKRKGWDWDPKIGAVLLQNGEQVIFHELGLTIIKSIDEDPDGYCLVEAFQVGETSPKVRWF